MYIDICKKRFHEMHTNYQDQSNFLNPMQTAVHDARLFHSVALGCANLLMESVI